MRRMKVVCSISAYFLTVNFLQTESAPLLQNGARHDEDESFFTRISNLTQGLCSYLQQFNAYSDLFVLLQSP